jgi:hypothetical protein
MDYINLTKKIHISATILFGLWFLFSMLAFNNYVSRSYSLEGLMEISDRVDESSMSILISLEILFVMGIITGVFYTAKKEHSRFRNLSIVNILPLLGYLPLFALPIPTILVIINLLYCLFIFWSGSERKTTKAPEKKQ